MSGPETHSVKRHLDVDAPGYDVHIRPLIPHYDEMIETGVQLLAALAPPDGHVLDLGGGTGALSSAVLDALPGVRVTVLDVDADMLGEARRRLARFGVASRCRKAASWMRCRPPTLWSRLWRCTTSMTFRPRLRFTQAIYDTLSPGGVLVNLDAAVTEGARLSGIGFDRWAARMGDHGITDV